MRCRNRSEMTDFLSLGLGRSRMILPRLLSSTSFMRRTHVLDLISSTEFKGTDMLNDPPLANTIDPVIADNTGASRSLPSLEPTPT